MCAAHCYILHFHADDFKPASVDTTRPAELVVGDTNEVTVTVPHVQVLHMDLLICFYIRTHYLDQLCLYLFYLVIH